MLNLESLPVHLVYIRAFIINDLMLTIFKHGAANSNYFMTKCRRIYYYLRACHKFHVLDFLYRVHLFNLLMYGIKLSL